MHNDTTVVIVILFVILIIVMQPRYAMPAVLAGLVVTAMMIWRYRATTSGFTAEHTEHENLAAVKNIVTEIVADTDNTITTTQAESIEDIDCSDSVNAAVALMQGVRHDTVGVYDGDQQLLEQMQHVSGQSKDATVARTRYTSDNFRRFFTEELDEQEKRIWWENDSVDPQDQEIPF